MLLRRIRPRDGLRLAGGAAAVLVVGTLGLALVTAGGPALVESADGAPVSGGAFLVSGQAANTGTVDAPNVVVTGTLTAPTLKSTVNLRTIAAGAWKAYSVSLPIGDSLVPGDAKFSTQASWDEPSLAVIGDQFSPTYQGGHGVSIHTGSVHNGGTATAPKVTLNMVATSDPASGNQVGSGSQTLGDIAAGADAAYNVTVDLGTNPPNVWYVHFALDYPKAIVNTGQESIKRVGGTVTVTGTLKNFGHSPADGVTVTRTLLDAGGHVVATGRTSLGQVRPGGSVAYKVTIELGGAAVDSIASLGGRVDFGQTQFLVLKTGASNQLRLSHWPLRAAGLPGRLRKSLRGAGGSAAASCHLVAPMHKLELAAVLSRAAD
jgi:hypothetical protein